LYGVDVPAQRIATWSQQTGTPPSLYSFGYDAVNQLLSVTVTNAGILVNTFGYSYDLAANRLSEQAGASTNAAAYNALNQLSTTTGLGPARTNEWDGLNRLTAVNSGNQRTEFTYDGASRLVGIRQLVNGTEVSRRQFVWWGRSMREERDPTGAVTKRFFPQGVKLETGPNAGRYFYTRDHLGSIRELTDAGGNVRARYAYDPFGRRMKVSGDLDADFGFAGMFWSAEANLHLTRFRAYDAELARWLSRDPLKRAELLQGPNLYAYVANNPVNGTDPLGLLKLIPIPNYWTEEQYQRWLDLWFQKTGHRGEIEEVLEEELQQTPEVALEPELASTAEEAPELAAELSQAPKLTAELPQVEEQAMVQFYRRFAPTPRQLPRTFPGFRAPVWQGIGAGAQILLMTDCDVVNGIFGLVRQGKGGLLNMYEDQMMKDLNQLQNW
jgi:RHS repeat-associated protein